ncbi:AAC(3) family N-acetyltransferase [Azospirillum sp. TSO22-1]|uniref:AAC(3) family N-acetyltransferase n=1 Tax=Azospirillum sp. TSO22-1 TaxID=716789 RepID=UPI000D651D48|nr:AAC(3) family N-acetyltransferase [Azospirillum sp. TSO22-1]
MTSAAARAVRELLDRLAVPRDGVLMLHSAFAVPSRAGLRAEAVLDALAAEMAPGTLLMPSMSWRAVNPDNPVFDELATPSITGILSELFRTRLATRRSLHPTHAVSGLGRQADALLAAQHLAGDTPCPPRSPWGLLDDHGAKVVMLGVGLESCTLIHHVEEEVAPGLYVQPPERRERYVCRDRHGAEFVVHTRRHLRLRRDFAQFAGLLEARGALRRAEFAGAPCLGFAAADLVAVVRARLRERADAIILPSPADAISTPDRPA